MPPPDPPGLTFLDEDGNELPVVAVDVVGGDDVDEVAARRAHARRARVEQWLPDGGGAAIAALVFVLVAWLGATPLVQAVNAIFPQELRQIGPTSDPSANFGNGQYFGVAPGLLPFVIYGTRALIVAVALTLAFRARRRERSVLATAAVTTASISLLLFLAAGVLLTIGMAMGHSGGSFTYPI